MADYHTKGAFSTGGKARLLSKFQFWGTPGNGADPKSSTFLAKTDQIAVRDHVSRPVIFGSDGKAMPVLFDFHRRHHKADGGGARADGSPKQATAVSAYRTETSYRPTEFVDHGRSSSADFHAPAESVVITTGGWTRPSKTGWAMPPHVPLEKAMSPRYMDAVNVVEFPATGSQSSYASRPNKSSSIAVIDSREAAKKYGGQFTW